MRQSALSKTTFRLGSVLALATGVAYAAQPSVTLKRDGSNWTQTDQGSISIDPAGQVRISAAGDIRIRGVNSTHLTYKIIRSVHATREADARALLERFPITSARQGRAAILEVAYGPCATNLEISVPLTLESSIVESAAGDIDISDLKGSVTAVASGGKINIGHAGGDIDARSGGKPIILGVIGGGARCISGGGSISATEIRGDARLETYGGDILLRKAGGKVRASTAGGGIQVVEATGMVTANTFGGSIQIGGAKGLHCESASGSIVAHFLPGIPIADSLLSTGSGDITVWIPSNLQISIRAQNEGSGNTSTVMSDYPGLRVMSAGSSVLADMLMNGGGPTLQLAGNGGRIYIKRR